MHTNFKTKFDQLLEKNDLTILTGKNLVLFYSIGYKNGWLAASDLFYMFTLSIKSIKHSICRIKSSDV